MGIASLLTLAGYLPNFQLVAYGVNDSTGNQDGRPDPGEIVDLTLSLHNSGADATNIKGWLSTDDTTITILKDSSSFEDISYDSTRDNSLDPFVFKVEPYAESHIASLVIQIQADPESAIFVDTIDLIIGTPPVLIVDNDIGTPYETYYTQSLDNIGILYDVWEKHGKQKFNLSNYHVVIWFTGDNSETPLDSLDVQMLSSYLDNGGNLFITGQDVEQGVDTNFYHNYLHANLVADSAGECIVYGVENDIIGDGLRLVILGGAGNQIRQSCIFPCPEADSVFYYQNHAGICGVKYSGVYRVLYLSFGFEGINYPPRRDILMQRVLNWFGIETGVEEKSEIRMTKSEIYVHPNPFSDKTVIRYSLNDYTINDLLLTVYDLSGRLIRTLPITDHRSPITEIVWDARDDTGKRVPSGVYFLQLATPKNKINKKLIVIH